MQSCRPDRCRRCCCCCSLVLDVRLRSCIGIKAGWPHVAVRGEAFTEPSVRRVIITGLNSGRTSAGCARTPHTEVVQFLDACIHTAQFLSGGVKKIYVLLLYINKEATCGSANTLEWLIGLQLRCEQSVLAVLTLSHCFTALLIGLDDFGPKIKSCFLFFFL